MSQERPLVATTVPAELIPPRGPREDYCNNRYYAQRLGPVIDHLAYNLPQDHVLRASLLEPRAQLMPGLNFGFRGLIRLSQPDLPIRPNRSDSTLETALKSIMTFGIEKPHSNLVWFVPNPKEALVYSIPQTPDQLGIIIVSNFAGMMDSQYGNGDYFQDWGLDPKIGYTFRDLHIGTIIYSLGGHPPLSYLEQFGAVYAPHAGIAA